MTMVQQFDKKELKKKSEDLSGWYTDAILKAEIADYAPVKGCMVIRPYGYAIWENVQEICNGMMKQAGVRNAYFPLFIPHSLLEKEKEHVEGFSPELAVVTVGGGEKLKDPLVVRPTSETIMYAMYAKWIHSWRDLPVLINQWNNVVRWEKRTYLFLRTTEFLWQEGHTAHETEQEAMDMVRKALDWYRTIYEDYYAMPVVFGRKSNAEKFAGAKATYSVEALMPDGKALQGATSHNLGQKFSRVFNIQFQSREGNMDYVWQTSWGLSTRSLGGLFLTHGDDSGLIMPPKVAPIHVVVVPIHSRSGKKSAVESAKNRYRYCTDLERELGRESIRAYIDAAPQADGKFEESSESPGRKFNKWEVKGVPLRFEIGDREVESKTVTIARRDTFAKRTVSRSDIVGETKKLLNEIQAALYARAKTFLETNTHTTDSFEEFTRIMNTSRGFIRAFWCEDAACEAAIKEKTKATTRCLPINENGLPDERSLRGTNGGSCIHCGKIAARRWLFAQAY